MKHGVNRRGALNLLALGAASLPLAFLRRGWAAESAVAEDEELALKLGYVTEAERADTTRFPKRTEPGGDHQFCRTCQFYQGEADSESGGCLVFGGREVQATGWCSSWFEKAG